jgi:Fur family ferric uptake transcriptional regulator
MKFFEELEIVESLEVGDGVKRYELNLSLHLDHLVCPSYSKIIEFTGNLI